jgi:hypothetical protein
MFDGKLFEIRIGEGARELSRAIRAEVEEETGVAVYNDCEIVVWASVARPTTERSRDNGGEDELVVLSAGVGGLQTGRG